MSQLIQINEYYIDPNRVISVVDGGAPEEVDIFVDMNEWTAKYTVQVEEGGWNTDSIAEAVNKGRDNKSRADDD